MYEVKIAYEPFKEIVVRTRMGYRNPRDLVYIFAQLRAAVLLSLLPFLLF